MMDVRAVPAGAFETNCYLIWREGAGSLAIDPGGEPERILPRLRERGRALRAILLTHGHMDHVSAAADLASAFPDAPVFMHERDQEWAFTEKNAYPPYYGRPESPGAGRLCAYGDGSHPVLADWGIEILETPGHTPGGVCLLIPSERMVFSGDTLFRGSVGRTDLAGGDARTLTESLIKLAALPEDFIVYPGHGAATRIGEERRNNPFLAEGSRAIRSRG
jgi:hydroxyacylglutathione hydrolase